MSEEPNAVTNTQARVRAAREPEQGEIHPGTQEHPDHAGQPVRLNDPVGELRRLEQFLAERFPKEQVHTPDGPEKPVDTAMRLLTKLTTHAQVERCLESYCNKPLGHRDEHGWVVREP